MPPPNAAAQPDARAQQDHTLELAIALLLRVGVFAAAALVLAGGLLALWHDSALVPAYRTFYASSDPHSQALHSIASIFGQLHTGSSAAIIGLGLLVLIATPIARVLFAAAGFARERDWLYTVISLVVFGILVFSLLHGR